MLQRAFGALMLVVGVVLFLVGLITRPDSTVTFIGLLAVGALCSIIGTAALGPLFAAPAARLLGSKSSAYVVLGVGAALIVLAGWLAVSQAGSILSGGEALDELREQMTPADGAPPSDSELKASTIGAGVVGLVLAALGVFGLSRPLARLRSDHPDRNRWFHQLGRGAFSAVMTVLVIGGIFSTFGAFGLAVPALAAGAALILGGQAGRSLAGQIAQGNAMRSPRRTATTAAALMIGLSLITSVTVVTESIRSALSGTFENSVSADYFVTDAEFTGFSPEVANRLEAVDGVTGVARLSEVSFDVTFEGAADPSDVGGLSAPTDLGDFLDVGVTEGSLADLTGDSVVILADVAEENGIEVGDVVPAVWDITDDEVDLEVVGLFDDESVLGTSWVVSSEAALAHGLPSQRRDGFVTFNVDPAVDGEALRAELQALVDEFPRLDLADKDEFAANQEGFLDQALRVLQVFLGLAVVIALIGIANTMALSVFERTRELGLIRAVGGTTHQVRQMIRWEAVIVSLFGGVLGATLGTVFGFVMVTALPDSIVTSFVFPWTDIAVYLVVAAVAGLAAAYFPARRAGRLDILEAISHD